LRAAAQRNPLRLRPEVGDQLRHRVGVGAKLGGAGIDGAGESRHRQAVSRNSSRPINMRRISDVPAPI
jgi:hypothetical protein